MLINLIGCLTRVDLERVSRCSVSRNRVGTGGKFHFRLLKRSDTLHII